MPIVARTHPERVAILVQCPVRDALAERQTGGRRQPHPLTAIRVKGSDGVQASNDQRSQTAAAFDGDVAVIGPAPIRLPAVVLPYVARVVASPRGNLVAT